MKKNPVIILTLVALWLSLVVPAGAQTATNQLSQVQIDLWPDLDRPSVLVLITAELPPKGKSGFPVAQSLPRS